MRIKKVATLAIICGQEEIEQGKITIKKLKSKKENDQISISSKNLINEIKNLFKILKSKGFKNIELDNIIESKYVLKRSGGSYRQFLFSFYDQNLKEWSLVPDLSVSSVVKFIQNKIKSKTKWFYTGEAYRKQNKNIILL